MKQILIDATDEIVIHSIPMHGVKGETKRIKDAFENQIKGRREGNTMIRIEVEKGKATIHTGAAVLEIPSLY